MEQASDHHGFLSRISSPAWRWGTLFACWGVMYLGWIDFVLLTNRDELHWKFPLLLWVAGGACLPLLVTHLAGLRFAPKRWLRVLLWCVSLCCLGMWLMASIELRCLDNRVYYIVQEALGQWWITLAMACQLAADFIHTVHEGRVVAADNRRQWRRSLAVGLAFALIPLGTLAAVALWGRLLQMRCEIAALVQKLEPWTAEREAAQAATWKAFKEELAKLEQDWKAGQYSDVFEKWLALKKKSDENMVLEAFRLRELPSLLRKGIPDDAALCQAIQKELRASETAMWLPLAAEYGEFHASCRSYLLDGSFWRGYDGWTVFQFVRFSHLTEPIEDVPFGVEKVFRWKAVQSTDEFYAMVRASLETPLAEMPPLEAKFDRWLDGLPWSFWEFAPNSKCMDGVGVHIHRYFDIHRMLSWQADCREAIIGIAVHQYRLKHGEWPADLAQLVPEFLPELPCDPFTGGALHLAPHPEIDGAVCVYSEYPLPEDPRPNERLTHGFPIPACE